MRVILFAAAVVLFAVACSTSGSDQAAAIPNAMTPRPAGEGTYVPTPTPDGAPRISLADAKKDFDAKAAVFIDTRASEQFAQGHIPGALNIGYTEIAAGKDDKIPKGKKIIAYCS
jgi:3-mercaptopyruvate sulfurtransferase SseA